MADDHPKFGQEIVSIAANGDTIVHSRSDTISVLDGESKKDFLQRVVRDFGVGPQDRVKITYKAGKPKFAVVEWARAEGR